MFLLLVNNGFKISHVSKWNSDKIKEELTSIYHGNNPQNSSSLEVRLNGLIVAMMELDEVKFNSIFKSNIYEFGLWIR